MHLANTRPIALAQAVLCILVTIAVPASMSAQRPFALEQPFTLMGEQGVGAQPVREMLTLDPRDEESYTSRVLLQTLQKLQFSILNATSVADPLQPKRDYMTDIAPLSEPDFDSYNRDVPSTLQLDKSVYYGVQYKIRYEVRVERDRYLYFEITPFLYERGSASTKWHSLQKPYSGEYFADGFERTLKGNLTQPQVKGGG